VFDTRHEMAGFVVAPEHLDLETAARELYRQVFAATAGKHLYRIWNYVPQINSVARGLENYRQFCRGRSVAFEDHFGSAYQRQLPSASAVGALHGPLAVAFLAGHAEPRHFENPRQVPAFEYPAIYGPRAPSFSRATLVNTAAGRHLFVSGTAAIRGHLTIAADDLAGQLSCTRENLDLIGRAAGAGANFGADEGWQRTFKVYIRHAADLGTVRADLERHLLREGDSATYLHADLCRADLQVEIEAILRV
jgi:chorismate lyase/3-hydroxybenzoate synthase